MRTVTLGLPGNPDAVIAADHCDVTPGTALLKTQQWAYGNTGDFAPTYYLQTDAPLYYYSFTDAYIAMAYRSLSKKQQARFDPTLLAQDGKRIVGTKIGSARPADDIPRLLEAA